MLLLAVDHHCARMIVCHGRQRILWVGCRAVEAAARPGMVQVATRGLGLQAHLKISISYKMSLETVEVYRSECERSKMPNVTATVVVSSAAAVG